MIKILVEVPDDFTDEECERVETQLLDWLGSDRPVCPINLKCHIIDTDRVNQKGATVEARP